MDWDYGILNYVFYYIGDIYIVYYFFLFIFYYYVVEVMEYLKKVLGEFYYKDEILIFKVMWLIGRYCCYVENFGDILWFKYD